MDSPSLVIYASPCETRWAVRIGTQRAPKTFAPVYVARPGQAPEALCPTAPPLPENLAADIAVCWAQASQLVAAETPTWSPFWEPTDSADLRELARTRLGRNYVDSIIAAWDGTPEDCDTVLRALTDQEIAYPTIDR